MQQNTPDRGRAESLIPDLNQTLPPDSPYTADEWLVLAETPVRIGRAMMAVSPSGPVGMTQEILALRKCCQDAFPQTGNPILLSIHQRLQHQDIMTTLWEDAGHAFGQKWDSANVRQTAVTSCQQAVTLLKGLSPQDAQTYKDFVYKTALNVAQAAREGGFMGIGGVSVSPEERALLSDISQALGLPQA